MPIYEYQHLGTPCWQGQVFEIKQSIHDAPLTLCPDCGGAVRKILSVSNINTPKTNTELKDLGFTKLVRRDKGVYENVTARDGDSSLVYGDRPETYPNFKKTITD